MHDLRSTGYGNEGPKGAPIQSTVALLRVVDGAARADAAPFAQALSSLARAQRSREGEELYFIFAPAGGANEGLCRELRDIIGQTYWSTSGSITSALRRSISLANRHLFEHNLNTSHADRCYGGVALAVLRDRDLFLLQAGPVWACVLQGGTLRCFPRGEKLAYLGIGPVADVRLHHVLASPGSALLLAPRALLGAIDEETLRNALSIRDVQSAAAGLIRMGGDEFVALLARWERASQREVTTPPRVIGGIVRHSEGPPLPDGPTRGPLRDQRPADEGVLLPERMERPIADRISRPRVRRVPREGSGKLKKTLSNVGAGLSGALAGVARVLGIGLSHAWHGIAAVGAGVVALVRWLAGALIITVRHTLPGQVAGAHRHSAPHPPPRENSTVMTVLAAAIPIVILVVVLIAYRQFATRSRFEGYIKRAEEQIALAQSVGGSSEEARAYWETALDEIETAAALEPEHPVAQLLRDQTREALDQLDGIHRLRFTQVINFGSSHTARRLVLTGQTLFVLDAVEGWVAGVPTQQGESLDNDEDSAESRPVVVRTGQSVDGAELGKLVDCVWVDAEGGRLTSALLVLEEEHRVVGYDPAWRSEGGNPQISLVELTSPPSGKPIAVGTYEGQFYILDGTAEGSGQIWRYKPQGDAYTSEPERYFASPPQQSLERATDMAIDGHIYVLLEDGRVVKFLGGESQPFDMEGIPGGLREVAGFAVDPDGDGSVYIADRGENRIIVLNPNGTFRAQLRGDPALTSLEALAVNQGRRRIWVLAEGRIYRATLP